MPSAVREPLNCVGPDCPSLEMCLACALGVEREVRASCVRHSVSDLWCWEPVAVGDRIGKSYAVVGVWQILGDEAPGVRVPSVEVVISCNLSPQPSASDMSACPDIASVTDGGPAGSSSQWGPRPTPRASSVSANSLETSGAPNGPDQLSRCSSYVPSTVT